MPAQTVVVGVDLFRRKLLPNKDSEPLSGFSRNVIKTRYLLDGTVIADSLVMEAVYFMKLPTRKIVFGPMLAISLVAFTLPARASVPPVKISTPSSPQIAGVQVAQLARDVDQKADELKDGATGAAHAVRAVHRRHERNEYRHHTIGSKLDSKVDEVKNETTGAGRAIERAHDRHEALEHAEGRD